MNWKKSLQDTEALLDGFVKYGNLDVQLVKTSKINSYTKNNDQHYEFGLKCHAQFKAYLYTVLEQEKVTPYLALIITLAALNNDINQEEIMRHLLRQSFDIFDPMKLALEDDNIVLSLRIRSDKISNDYLEELLATSVYFGEKYLHLLVKEFHLQPFMLDQMSLANQIIN